MVKLKITKNINDFVIYSNSLNKTKSNILWCFCSLKFENSLLSNKILSCIFRGKRTVYIAEKGQIVGNKACVCVSGGKKCLFFGNFDVLCFLETPVLRFALLSYSRRN